jgi:3-hydroxy acid dehydrogenase / malonic semialdehyde reductase
VATQSLAGKTAVVTGASSGIGRSTALALAGAGVRLALGARRVDRLEQLVRELPGTGHLIAPLDVTDPMSSEAFVQQAAEALDGRIDILVNNAGLALGRSPVVESDLEEDRIMLETNVLGLMRMTQLCFPYMEDWRGHIVNLGSWAGREAYRYGSGYVVSKWGVRVLTEMLRKELIGRIRVTTVDPGMVGDTEFSVVRFKGDLEKKDAVYAGVRYLTPDDVADCILWAVTRPPNVNIDEIVLKPLQQGSQELIVREN